MSPGRWRPSARHRGRRSRPASALGVRHCDRRRGEQRQQAERHQRGEHDADDARHPGGPARPSTPLSP